MLIKKKLLKISLQGSIIVLMLVLTVFAEIKKNSTKNFVEILRKVLTTSQKCDTITLSKGIRQQIKKIKKVEKTP